MKQESMMTAFMDFRDPYTLDVHTPANYSFSSSFDSSFSSDSSGSSWEMLESPCPTPLSGRRTSYGSLDYDGLSAGSVSQVTTPVGHEFVPSHSMGCMTQNMLAIDEPSYFSSCTKPHLGRSLMMEYPYLPAFDSSFGGHGQPHSMYFEHHSSADMALSSSSHSFVDPSHTLFQPATPLQPPKTLGSSPEYGQSPGLQYFLTPTPPRSTQSPASFSSASRSSTKLDNIKLGASAALHRVQSEGSRVKKSAQKKGEAFFSTSVVAAGHFRCDFPNCESKHAFKRQEHLKRHKKTHYASKDLICAYCNKRFQEDRRDNYRSHIVLHATSRNKKGSRTKFHPGAVIERNSWGRKKDAEDDEFGSPLENRPRSRASRS